MIRVVVATGEAYAPDVCVIVFLVARGVSLLVARLAERRGRKPPPGSGDDELVLAA